MEDLIRRARTALLYESQGEVAQRFVSEGVDPGVAFNAVKAALLAGPGDKIPRGDGTYWLSGQSFLPS